MVKIVLIDDDPISIFVTEKLIQRNITEPCKVFTFDNAMDALKDIYQINPHYLFLDLNMPEMSGWDFLEIFDPVKQDPEIYILSSSVDERDINKANQYEKVKKYLSKPLIKQYIHLIFGKNRQDIH
ncbi:Response regulator receiver domain-containing protein [Cyclobacterium lianum]|uniref:Response regulator receiver domain-containing protein n=1 Tax=Cyclobacterium lianum TaxID=388280 RepID=A0A1M7Q7Z9_9BACT|nr:response regulator [Cyclobacterium lianum]SHN26737.1 Response regulator receiver domain-containing protein [Cyclobacterium lianum]